MIEAHAQNMLAVREQLAQRRDGMVDGEMRDQRAVLAAMAASHRDQPRHIIVGDVGDELVLAEKF